MIISGKYWKLRGAWGRNEGYRKKTYKNRELNTISDIKPCSKGCSHINILKCKPREEADEATTHGHNPDNSVSL